MAVTQAFTQPELEDNPVRQARLSIGKTISQASKMADVHWQVWYLTECGVYSGVPPAIEKFLEGRGINIVELGINYAAFQKKARISFQGFSGISLPSVSLDENPFTAFRESLGISRTRLAKLLCVQPAVLYKVERGESFSLPAQLAEALEQAGLAPDLIEELNERQREFYEHQRYSTQSRPSEKAAS